MAKQQQTDNGQLKFGGKTNDHIHAIIGRRLSHLPAIFWYASFIVPPLNPKKEGGEATDLIIVVSKKRSLHHSKKTLFVYSLESAEQLENMDSWPILTCYEEINPAENCVLILRSGLLFIDEAGTTRYRSLKTQEYIDVPALSKSDTRPEKLKLDPTGKKITVTHTGGTTLELGIEALA